MPWRGLGLPAWCVAAGFIPAALTWESLPHALRSISVWPCWAILAGCVLAAVMDAYPWADVAVAVTALAFCLAFATVYFVVHPRMVAHYFDVGHKELAERASR